MSNKSLITEYQESELAIALIELGARLQILETETLLSRGRLLKLYREVVGTSPPKGQLPFSSDWFIVWMPNIQSSLFLNIYERLRELGCARMSALIKAYRLYHEQMRLSNQETLLSFTRAWTLLRFIESEQLEMTGCTLCHGRYIIHTHSLTDDYVCGVCQPPSRAGAGKRRSWAASGNAQSQRRSLATCP